MQELAYGGVPEHIKSLLLGKTVLKHAEDNDGTCLPPVGTRLVKTYRGKEYNVIVSTAGFQFEGIYYKSLSAVALKITGNAFSLDWEKINENHTMCRLYPEINGRWS